MFTRRAFAGLVAAGAASGASAAAAQSSTAPGGRSREAAALRAFAETTHPRGREATADSRWREHWDGLIAKADRLDDGAYAVGLLRGLGWFKDGHTTLLPFDFTGGVPDALKGGPFGQAWPLKARAFYDGLYVTDAGGEAAPLLGARITAINGVSDIEVMRRWVELWPANSPSWGHRQTGNLFGSAGYALGLGFIKDAQAPVRVEAVAASGSSVSAALRLRPDAGKGLTPAPRTPSEREGWAKAAKGGNYVRPLPRSRLIYASIDEMGDLEGMKFADLTRQLFAVMARPGFDRVVIDLSRNGGGDNFLGEPLRKGLERSRFNRPGGLYVITSPRTFSAAQNLTNRLERETYAIFVGEPTGGAPNHYGDAKPFHGEATGLTAIVSSLPWFDSYPMDPRPWVAPDLAVPQTFAAWKEGRDLALARILTHKTSAQPDEFADDRVYYFGRASQKAKWEPWWRG